MIDVQRLQGLSTQMKLNLTEERIKEWYEYWEGQVYVAFSGGLDSTVLLNIVRNIYPDIQAAFVDTGLEYPEIRNFVKEKDNVLWLYPKIPFHKVIKKYGYPLVSKEQARYIKDCQNPTPNNIITRRRRMTGINGKGEQTKTGMISKKWQYLINAPFKISEQCCDKLKKYPFHQIEKAKKPIIGIMAEESSLRKQSYAKNGCNMFTSKISKSAPLSFWLKKDIWNYIKNFNLSYSPIYNTGVTRTGCMFCMFGVHLEKEPNRFQLMRKTHPEKYDYCINRLGLGAILDYINVPYI